MKRAAVALSVLVIGAGILPAGQPDMYTFSGSGQVWIGDCPGFEVWEDAAWEVVGKDYYNKNGDFVRQKWHWTVEGFVFNLDAPDNKLHYKNSVYNEHYVAETNDSRYTGLWAVITVPGYGSIFMDVGLIVYNYDTDTVTFEAGKHQWWNANVDALCEHLAE
jgi:hypothetical protein